ncbi:MAG: hypothetical protein M1818_000972 [Claussenomyces sp. TS43310]|nr:MAG: hypothetical protein M1818_000972 [Claussenomyces sp. TS43310]
MAPPLPQFLMRRLASSPGARSFPRVGTASSSVNTQPAARAAAATARSQFHSSSAARVAGGGGGPRPGQEKVKFWPFLAVAAVGSGAYVWLVQSRVDPTSSSVTSTGMMTPTSSGLLKAPAKATPTFSPRRVTVLFVLGGPGAGKGTQCANLVRDYGFTHLSAGDLLRAEQDRAGSEFGALIKDCIRNGAIVPMEVTVQLLENAMADTLAATPTSTAAEGKFLIDGFPRKMDQALKFEESVCPARFVLFFDCPEEEMQRRLLKRGETSGRTDDNAESIKKRFKTFVDTSMPVVDYYAEQGKVVRIAATKAPDAVYEDVKKSIAGRLGKDL